MPHKHTRGRALPWTHWQRPPSSPFQHKQTPRPPQMSQTPSTAASSPNNFQLIFNNALKAYEKQTKNDLLAHPLAAQLQACNSPSAVLSILQQQVHEFDQSRSGDGQLTRWLDPTVNVLFAFSAALREGVGMVRLMTWTRLIALIAGLSY